MAFHFLLGVSSCSQANYEAARSQHVQVLPWGVGHVENGTALTRSQTEALLLDALTHSPVTGSDSQGAPPPRYRRQTQRNVIPAFCTFNLNFSIRDIVIQKTLLFYRQRVAHYQC